MGNTEDKILPTVTFAEEILSKGSLRGYNST
jgi:hypothetical protein